MDRGRRPCARWCARRTATPRGAHRHRGPRRSPGPPRVVTGTTRIPLRASTAGGPGDARPWRGSPPRWRRRDGCCARTFRSCSPGGPAPSSRAGRGSSRSARAPRTVGGSRRRAWRRSRGRRRPPRSARSARWRWAGAHRSAIGASARREGFRRLPRPTAWGPRPSVLRPARRATPR